MFPFLHPPKSVKLMGALSQLGAAEPSPKLNSTASRQVNPALPLAGLGLCQEILGLWVREWGMGRGSLGGLRKTA